MVRLFPRLFHFRENCTAPTLRYLASIGACCVLSRCKMTGLRVVFGQYVLLDMHWPWQWLPTLEIWIPVLIDGSELSQFFWLPFRFYYFGLRWCHFLQRQFLPIPRKTVQQQQESNSSLRPGHVRISQSVRARLCYRPSMGTDVLQLEAMTSE